MPRLSKTRQFLTCQQSTPENPIPEALHRQFIQRVKEYFLIGGMPAVVRDFKTNRSFLELGRVQDLLLATYRSDFSKYATGAEQKYLRAIFEGIPYQIGQQFKYSEIDPHIKSRE